jgi:hypothetical protein
LLASISREAGRFVILHAADPPESLVHAVRHGAFRDGPCQFQCTPATAAALSAWLHLRAEAMQPAEPAMAAVLAEAAADIGAVIAGGRP